MNKTVTSKYARDNWAEIINQVAYGGKTFIITKHGKSQAVITAPTETFNQNNDSRQKKLDKLFGAWSHRTEIQDSVEYAKKLRASVFDRNS